MLSCRCFVDVNVDVHGDVNGNVNPDVDDVDVNFFAHQVEGCSGEGGGSSSRGARVNGTSPSPGKLSCYCTASTLLSKVRCSSGPLRLLLLGRYRRLRYSRTCTTMLPRASLIDNQRFPRPPIFFSSFYLALRHVLVRCDPCKRRCA